MYNKDEIILGKKLFGIARDSNMDSLILVEEKISNIFSNFVIDNAFKKWNENIIVLDFKDEFYFKNHFIRREFGEIINFSEEDLYYNPFLLVGKIEDTFSDEIVIFKKYKNIVTEMYEVAEKYFKMDTTYKNYIIDLILSAIYFLKENNKKISINNLTNVFSSKKNPYEKRVLEILKNYGYDFKIYKPIVNFLNLDSYSARDRIKSSIINILKIFEDDCLYTDEEYDDEEYDDEEINQIFGENKYNLFLSLNSFEDKLSKAKIKFFINQVLKNRKSLKNETLFIIPDFKILNEISEIKEILFDINNSENTKLLLISNAKNLSNLTENSLMNLRNSKILLSSESAELIEKQKYFTDISFDKRVSKNEMLYIKDNVLTKLKRITKPDDN